MPIPLQTWHYVEKLLLVQFWGESFFTGGVERWGFYRSLHFSLVKQALLMLPQLSSACHRLETDSILELSGTTWSQCSIVEVLPLPHCLDLIFCQQSHIVSLLFLADCSSPVVVLHMEQCQMILLNLAKSAREHCRPPSYHDDGSYVVKIRFGAKINYTSWVVWWPSLSPIIYGLWL